MSKIKERQSKPGKRSSPNTKIVESSNDSAPIFCLDLQPGYCLESCTKEEKAAFADALFKRSRMSWNEIIQTTKGGLGCEKINLNAIKTSIPKHLTGDVSFFLALRFNGKAPMVGYRVGRIFHILWLDRDFTLYKH